MCLENPLNFDWHKFVQISMGTLKSVCSSWSGRALEIVDSVVSRVVKGQRNTKFIRNSLQEILLGTSMIWLGMILDNTFCLPNSYVVVKAPTYLSHGSFNSQSPSCRILCYILLVWRFLFAHIGWIFVNYSDLRWNM